MAINVHYQPPMEMISQAAYRAGLGQFNQRQQQIALQQQEAAIAQAQRQQQLALQARGQDFEMQRALQNDQLRREMAAVDAMERQQQFAQNEMRNQAYLEQLRQNDPQLRANLQWQQQSSENLDKMASEFEAVMSKKTLNEPGAALRQKLVGDLRQIRSMRNKMLPNQYAEAMQKWFKSVDESGIENYEEFAPTPDEMRQQRSVQIDEHNIMTFDENGRPSVQRLQTPPAPKSEASIVADDGTPVPFDQFVRNNYGELRKMKAEARKAIIEERKLQQGDEITITPPTTEEIMKRVREEYEADLQAIGGQQPPAPAQQSSQSPTAVWRYENGQLIRVQ